MVKDEFMVLETDMVKKQEEGHRRSTTYENWQIVHG